MNYMSKIEQEEVLGLSDDLKDSYFVLLQKSPLTLGEICFLTKKSEDKIKTSLKKLIDLGYAKAIDDTIPLYVSIFPTKLLKGNLDQFIKNFKEFESNYKEKNNEDLENALASLNDLKTSFQTKSTSIIQEYTTKHDVSLQDLENESQNIIKTTNQNQLETLKEISNDFTEQRASSITNLTSFSDSLTEFFTQINSKFDILTESLQNLTTQNKRLLRKSITETIKSLDEGAKLLGKNVNDQLKSFESKLIDSINSSISATVDLSNGFKTQLVEDYSTWRAENSEYVNNLGIQNENLLSETLNENLNYINTSNNNIVEKLQSILDNFNKIAGDLSKKTSKVSDEKITLYFKDIEDHTKRFSNYFINLKGEMETNLTNYQVGIEDYEKSLNSEIKSFLAGSLQNFEENFKFLSQILSEFINNAKTSFDKEYIQTISDNNDILDKIVELLGSLKSNYENELADLQNNIQILENSFKDLSVAIKRRFDKFSSEAASLLNSVGNKIIDELLNIQGSNIDLLEEHKELKQNFSATVNSFVERNSSLMGQSQENFSILSENILAKKLNQLDEIEKEIKDYSSFINDRHAILDNQLKTKNEEFITEFRTALAKIRESAQVIIQTEQTEYLSSLADINSNSDVLLLQQKDTIVEALDSISTSISKSIQEAIDSLTQSFTKIKNSIVNDISQHKSTFTQTFNEINDNVEEISSNYITNYKSVLESSINSLKNVEMTYWSKFEDTFSKNKEKVLEIYKTNTDSLQTKTNSVVKSLSGFLDEIVESFSGVNTEVSDSINAFSSEMSTKLTEIQDSTESQFQVFEDLSNSLDQISQKSKLEIEKELLDIENELKSVTDKNYESYTQLITSTTAQFDKTLTNLSEVSVGQITDLEKENLDFVKSVKQESEENRETHLTNLTNLSKDSLNELNGRSSKQLSTIKESKIQLEEKSVILTEQLRNQLLEYLSTFQSGLFTQFDTMIETIPVQMKDYVTDFKNSLKELFETLNQQIFKPISDNVTNSTTLIKNSQLENQKTLQQGLNQLKVKFSDQITELKDEYLETSKLRLEEIELQINKELEIFSSKLVKKENVDVQKLRELIQSMSSVGIFNDLVNENLIANIDPLKNNIETSIGVFQTDFEKIIGETNISELDELRQKTTQEFNDLLINAYNTSIGKLNTIQKSFSDQLNEFQNEVKNFIEKTIEKSKSNELELIKSNENELLTYFSNEGKKLAALMNNVINSFSTQNETLNSLLVNYSNFFNSIHSVVSEPSADNEVLYKSRIINVPEDVYKYLEDIIDKTDKRIDLVIPKPEFLDPKPIINLKTRVRIKIIINLNPKTDKSDKRKNWVYDLYKKKANVQLYDSTAISDLIICIRDNTEVLIVSESKKNELSPGFIIQNQLFSDYFSKSIVNNIILSSTPISRENQK